MLRILRSKKAQSTAEYAILIGLVVAALIAMQTYVKRGLNAKMKDATDRFATTTNLGSTNQYEPYYLQQNTATTQSGNENEFMATGGNITRSQNLTTTRTGNAATGW
jgi:Flp pilus assembly pilin Flp